MIGNVQIYGGPDNSVPDNLVPDNSVLGQFGPGRFGTRTIRIRTIRYQDYSVLVQFGPEMTITQ